ncbi:MAG: MmcQ/YjbR family DNA-binding protein [Clostridia bacterium]|nr:MmcQ/YjbR family DNA-binding protein [Clostridia bacterium]
MKTEREKIADFALTLPGAVLDMPFEDDFETTVFRHGEGGKWFGLLMRVEKSRVGLAGEGKADVLNLKCDPDEAFIVRELYEGIIPAYHMNKRHWISVILEGGVPLDFTERLIEKSYALTEKKCKTRKK